MGDAMNMNAAGYAAFSSISWLSNSIESDAARNQRYKQFDQMDTGDVTRALDIIAEETTGSDKRTGLPFVIDYQVEDDQQIPDNVVTTIRATLRYWAKFHNLHRRLFNIARVMVKYGDCFFRKTSDTSKWEYVDPSRVVGIEVDEIRDVVAYFIRPAGWTSKMTGSYGASEELDRVPAEAMLHFSLSNEMGDYAPFGMSILQPVFKDFQKLTMLESAAIIFRLVRAPEKRVWKIDTGNANAAKAKIQMQMTRDELRQKRTPSAANGDFTDGNYNPECLALDTLIPLLDGRELTLEELIVEHANGKVNYAYSVDPKTGRVVPGVITWAGITRKNADRIMLTFDNGQSVIVTPDHKFPTVNRGFVQAQELAASDELFKFEVEGGPRESVWDHDKQCMVEVDRISIDFMEEHPEHIIMGLGKGEFITHLDSDQTNNVPSNLVRSTSEDVNFAAARKWFDTLSEDDKTFVCLIIAGTFKFNFTQLPRKEIAPILFKRLVSLFSHVHGGGEANTWATRSANPDLTFGLAIATRGVLDDHSLDLPTVVTEKSSVKGASRIVSITRVEPADVGTLTIDGKEVFNDYHTFALSAGVFTKNSIQEDIFLAVNAAGRGNTVETLGGQGDWSIPELDYFQDRVFRGLRVPSSYMKGTENGGGAFNDGKTGVAYMEERIFANFCMRLQGPIEDVLDAQFKTYIQAVGINVDVDSFKLVLVEPQNFAMYRQAALSSELISNFTNIQGTDFISKRFMLEHFLGLTKDEIQTNEILLKQERNITDAPEADEIQQIYDPAVFENRDEIKLTSTGNDDQQSSGFNDDSDEFEDEPEDDQPVEDEPEEPSNEEPAGAPVEEPAPSNEPTAP
jgi:hypothetical protein